MDGRRFDDLTRALTATGPRRSVLQGAIGAAVAAIVNPGRTGRAAAPPALAPVGGVCADASWCAPADPATGWVTCADNGVTLDGSANCCLVSGSRCASDRECCGSDLCLPPGICGGAAAAGLVPPQYCASVEQCSQHPLLGPADCADNGVVEDGPTNCCHREGGSCDGDAWCCGALRCRDGTCGP